MVQIAKRRSTMFKKATAALLLATLAASVATTVFAASGEPNQVPGYDRNGSTVPIPNPDRGS
jgi:hypothetical protein